MHDYCFLNGEIVDVRDTHVSLNDLGLLRGYSVFDFCRTYQGEPFLLERYTERLFHSAGALRLEISQSPEQLKKEIHRLFRKNKVDEAAIRFLVSGGPTPDGISIGTPTVAILIEDVPQYPDPYYQEGIKLVTYPYQRLFPDIKTTNYLPAVKLTPWREQKGAQDILYCHQRQVRETTRSNLFLIKGKTLVTPSEGILPGITRQYVCDLLEREFTIEKRPIPYEELSEADEAFITGTSKKVMPVVQIDDQKLNGGKVGPKTKTIMQRFEDATETPIIES